MSVDPRKPIGPIVTLAVWIERGLPIDWLVEHGEEVKLAADVLDREPGRFVLAMPAEPKQREALEAAGLTVIVRPAMPGSGVVIDQAALGVVE